MTKPIHIAVAAVALLLCAGAASAQNPANVAVVSGNGQMICQCVWGGPSEYFFRPLVVRVTDAAGVPVSGASVNWAITNGGWGGTLANNQTSTDGNGLSTNFFTAGPSPNGAPGFNFQQTVITVTAGSGSAPFTLTQGAQSLPIQTGGIGLTPFVIIPAIGGRDLVGDISNPWTGAVGSTLAPPIKIAVLTAQFNQPIPNVAVFIQNDQTADQGPTLACQTQSGAGTNVVLTDSAGIATCNPVFGGVPNVNGTARVIVGGAIPVDGVTTIYAFTGSQTLFIRATPGAPSQIRQVSGNNQSAQAGNSLVSPLVVEVLSGAGSPVSGTQVNWTVSPSTAASLGSAQTTTDSTGRASNSLRFAQTTTGAITITASLASDPSRTVSFTATAIPNVTLSGLQIVSGNNQSALVNTNFSAPLVVQVDSTAGPASGIGVTFTISGPGTLSASSATTAANGQAQVTVSAGATTGTINVTASAGGFSQSFSLTVSPAGPTLTANSFFNAADMGRGALSPCSLATIIANGIAPGLQGMVNANPLGLLPGVLANTRVTVGSISAPLLSVGRNLSGQESLTFQVPCDVTPGTSVPVVVSVGAGNATVNVPIQVASPGIFTTMGTDGVTRAVVVRPDGSFVSQGNPARRGENLVALVTGLGPSIPVVGTNSVAQPGSVTSPNGTIVVGMAGRGVPLITAQLSDDQIGVWRVTFTVPADINTGSQNFSISVIPSGSSTPLSSNSAVIPIQ